MPSEGRLPAEMAPGGVTAGTARVDQPTVAGSVPATEQDREAHLDHLFRHWTLSPVMRQLRRLLGAYQENNP